MSVRYANENEILNWDSLILLNPDGGNFLQGLVFSEIKSLSGWKSHKIICSYCAVSVLEKTIIGLGKIWYVPKGPGISDFQKLKTTLEELKVLARQKKVFLIKIEPEIIKNNENINKMRSIGISSGSIQPNNSTVYIKIEKNTDQMLTKLSQKTRHAINRARRDGIKVKELEINKTNSKIMLALMKETMQNKKALLRADEYYKTFWKYYYKKNQGKLFIAYDNNRPIAGAFVILFGNKATYKDGGSLKEKTIYGASHALQWHIIEWLSKNKFINYDLCGTPASDKIEDKLHPYYGIGQFKTSFNKEVIDYVGVYDIPIVSKKYKIWIKFISKITNYYYKYFLKQIFF